MNSLQKFLLLSLTLAGSTTVFAAEQIDAKTEATTEVAAESEKAVDPADITRVVTALKVSAGTNSNNNDLAIETELKIGGSFNKGNNFLTMISATVAEKDGAESKGGDEEDMDVRELRARWFQVFATGVDWLPKAGYSLDYIDQSNDDSTAVDNIIAAGVIVKVPVLSNWVMYPNIAAVTANVNDVAKSSGMDDGVGVQLNVFNAIYLSKAGSYMMINPQYSYIDFDNVVTQDLLVETTFGTPITDNKKWWFSATYKETFSDVNPENGKSKDSFKANDDKRQFRVGVTYYF